MAQRQTGKKTRTFSYGGIWWLLTKASRPDFCMNSGRGTITYRGRCSLRISVCTDFCQALRSVRPEAGAILLSVSNLAMMSSDSAIAPSPSTQIGAIFLPTSAVGVSTSSLPMKVSLCFTPRTPAATRTRTQKGQWSYT